MMLTGMLPMIFIQYQLVYSCFKTFQIVDPETKQEKGVGEMGEIFLRGPNIMKGYLNKPQATADILDRDGWLQTGG